MSGASQVYKSRFLDKQLMMLARADSRAAQAARWAGTIIDDFVEIGSSTAVEHRLTRHGELRLNNCFKFDLGCGYRLIAQRREQDVYFLFAGHHDACDRWLESRRSTTLRLRSEKVSRQNGAEQPVKRVFPEAVDDGTDEYEREFAALLDEKTLRLIFRGICS